MEFERQVNRRLHEEHEATLRLCARLEQALARPLDPPQADLESALREADAALADEVARHFDFEERELFPRLAAAGEGDLAELLAEEHARIRAIARRFSALRTAMRSGPIDAEERKQLRVLGLELADELASHARKEEGSLLPSLDQLLGEDEDRALFAGYVLA